jgi:hypothetical protein
MYAFNRERRQESKRLERDKDESKSNVSQAFHWCCVSHRILSRFVSFRFYSTHPRTSTLGRCSAACMHTATSSMALDTTDNGSVSPILTTDRWVLGGGFER